MSSLEYKAGRGTLTDTVAVMVESTTHEKIIFGGIDLYNSTTIPVAVTLYDDGSDAGTAGEHLMREWTIGPGQTDEGVWAGEILGSSDRVSALADVTDVIHYKVSYRLLTGV